MQVISEDLSPTKVKLTITADSAFSEALRLEVIHKLGKSVKVQGFRAGKAPDKLIEKQLDQNLLQTEFLETAVNQLYIDAIRDKQLRPVQEPEVTITKFVPFSALEVSIEVDVISKVVLPDLAKIKLAKTSVNVTDDDVKEVLKNLQTRAAAKVDVQRAAKNGDQVTIDFSGVDAKTAEPIEGADGKDYPLELGSGSFIPGFEPELIGLKAGDVKDFVITFPKDYGVASLQSRKVKFSVTIKLVHELVLPKLDADFVTSVGPFKSLAELKADVKKQLLAERQQQAEQEYDNQLLQTIAEQTEVTIPESLITAELERIEEEEKRNLVYRGQTWQEHLDSEKITAEEHRDKNREPARLRVKAGLVLAEVSTRERISVTPDELNMRIELLKGRYADEKMRSELDETKNRQDIANRIMTEKTIDRIKALIAQPTKHIS